MVKGGKQLLKPTAAEGGDRPAAAEKSSSSSEQPMLEEGLYELEAIRRKRMRKGVPYYLVKWLGYPEAENTWEPRQNLESFCSHVIDSFEKSLKTAKKSSCKRKRKGAASQPKKREQTPPAAAATPSAEPLTRENSLTSSPIEDSLRVEEANPVSDGAVEAGEENNLHLKISELKVSAATNGEQSVIEQGGPANDTLLSGRCIGARRRKSGIVKRFIPQPGASTIDGVQDVSAPIFFCGMATNQGIQNGSSGISKTLDDSSRITELLNMISCTSTIINNNAKDVLIMFTAKRADGTQVPVNNKFLKAYYPHLLIKFYEQHLWCTPHGI